MNAAIDHAERERAGWMATAYQILEGYAKDSERAFLCEDVRTFATGFLSLPEPPSHRSWGALMVKAQKAGLIRHAGYARTNNPKAHKTPASLWIKA